MRTEITIFLIFFISVFPLSGTSLAGNLCDKQKKIAAPLTNDWEASAPKPVAEAALAIPRGESISSPESSGTDICEFSSLFPPDKKVYYRDPSGNHWVGTVNKVFSNGSTEVLFQSKNGVLGSYLPKTSISIEHLSIEIDHQGDLKVGERAFYDASGGELCVGIISSLFDNGVVEYRWLACDGRDVASASPLYWDNYSSFRRDQSPQMAQEYNRMIDVIQSLTDSRVLFAKKKIFLDLLQELLAFNNGFTSMIRIAEYNYRLLTGTTLLLHGPKDHENNGLRFDQQASAFFFQIQSVFRYSEDLGPEKLVSLVNSIDVSNPCLEGRISKLDDWQKKEQSLIAMEIYPHTLPKQVLFNLRHQQLEKQLKLSLLPELNELEELNERIDGYQGFESSYPGGDEKYVEDKLKLVPLNRLKAQFDNEIMTRETVEAELSRILVGRPSNVGEFTAEDLDAFLKLSGY